VFGGHEAKLKIMRYGLEALPGWALVVCVGCDPLCVAKGRVVDADGMTGASCTVKLLHRPGDPEEYGETCQRPSSTNDDTDYSVVRLGDDFECTAIPGSPKQILVSCEGYETYRSSSFEWKVMGITCRSFDLGKIVLRRVHEVPEEG
jgi:hypothetical protein